MIQETMPFFKDFITSLNSTLVPVDHPKRGGIPISENFESINFGKPLLTFLLKWRFVVLTINHYQT